MAGDPCPAGFSIPTKAEWNAVLEYNTITFVGSWLDVFTNYTSAIRIGNELLLPAAGYRSIGNGTVRERGNRGCYLVRSSSFKTVGFYQDQYFYYGILSAYFSGNYYWNRNDEAGVSVRCIEE